MNYDCLIKAAKWMGNYDDVARFTKLKELSEKCKFYVTVWGHFSSGKSRLINNIINRDILPVQTRETTAVLTYIQYGINEECVIIWEDGTATKKELSYLKNIFQNTETDCDVSSIDHLEVYLNNELLKDGLVLVDTPGVNTIIQKHQDLAVDAIEQSGRIIYVLGSAPSNTDRQFVNQITDSGIKISFVRTKCDYFMTSEENADDSIQKEKKEIENILDSSIEYIAVSNEKDNKWHKNINTVRQLLRDLSLSISEELIRANEKKIFVYCYKYINLLNIECQRITDIIEGNEHKYDSEIEEYESEIKNIEEITKDIEFRISESLKKTRRLSERELDELITKRINDFSKALNSIEYSDGMSIEVKNIYTNHLAKTIEKIQKILNTHFEEIIKDQIIDISSCISSDFDIQIPTYSEVQQENSRIIEIYRTRLLETKQKIVDIMTEKEKIGDSATKLEADIDETAYVEAINALNQELQEIPSGMAMRLADNQGVQPSAVFKSIGNAADLALLLIPGDVIFKGVKVVANTTQIAQLLHKMGKVGEVIVKTGTVIGKNAKVIDTVRDTTYAINTVLNKRNYSTQAEKEAAEKLVDKAAGKARDAFEKHKEKQRSGNVLDALSVAYWSEKFGKQFDSGPKLEIDIEEQKRRDELRKNITEEQQRLSQKRLEDKKRLGLLKHREAELTAKEKEEEITKKKIEEEIIKQENIALYESKKNALERFSKEYVNYYGEIITQIANSILSQYFQGANQNLTMYISNQTTSIEKELHEKKSQLERLISLKDSGDEIKDRLAQCKLLIDNLENEINENNNIRR